MAGSNSPGVILQPRDRRLLSELELLRVVDREQARIVAPFGSVTRANSRLLALTRAGYLQRITMSTESGGRKALYTIPGRARNIRGNAAAREQGFAHQLALNRLYCAFRYAPAPRPEIAVIEWRRFDSPLLPTVPIIPDGYVRIRAHDEVVSAFVEVDLGTERRTVWQRKVSSYLALAMSGAHRELMGDERFRVLVVVHSERRLESLQEEIARQTTKVFWLATSEAIERDGVWSANWHRPSQGAPQALL